MDPTPERPASLLAEIRTAAMLLTAFTLFSLLYAAGLAAIAALLPVEPAGVATSGDRTGPEWFHGRPDATAGGVSGGSNLGPTSPALAAAVAGRLAAVRAENPAHAGPVPVDLVTASASGFDPHLSPAAVRLQVPRVAAATGTPEEVVRDLVERAIEPRSFGLFGHPRVDVARLNERLAQLLEGRHRATDGGAP